MKPLACKILLALALLGGVHTAFAQVYDSFPLLASTTNGFAPLTVQFTAPSFVSGPGIGDHPVSYYNWFYGDGSVLNNEEFSSTSHTYTNPGTYYPYASFFSFTNGHSYGPEYSYGPPITVSLYSLNWFKVAGGGGTSSGGVYTMSDTIGQQDAGGTINGGGYSVTFGFWSLLGQATSQEFIPTVPMITTQPQSQIVPAGNPVSFNVSVSGTPPFSYQWQKNGANLYDGGNISGSAISNLVLSTTSTNDAGSYDVIVYNAYGNVVYSCVANLTFVLPAYYVTDLGSLGGSQAYAQAINNSGQVVGYSETASRYDHAFLYNSGTMNDLSTLGGYDSYAQGINNSGQVVGYSYTAGNSHNNPFLYSGGTMSDLLSDDGFSYAYGINDNGQIVGNCDWYSGSSFGGETYLGDFGFLYSGGAFTDLGALGGTFSYALGINNSGRIIGYSGTASGYDHAFSYSGGTMSDLGTLGGNFSYAHGINNSGQVVGYAAISSGYYHAFLYSGGTMNDLGTLGGSSSFAYGINNSSQVVGGADTAGGNPDAFLYSGGTMFDLNNLVNTTTLGDYLYIANGINDSGQIIANGLNGDAFILTPSLPGSYATGPFPPIIQVVARMPGQFTFNWQPVNTYPSVGYQVQYTTNLMSPWINLGGVITSGNLSFTNSIGSNPQGFYRVFIIQ